MGSTMILSIRITFIIIFLILCRVYHYHYEDIHASPKHADTVAKKKQMFSMTLRNGESVPYHKKRFGLFYRPPHNL